MEIIEDKLYKPTDIVREGFILDTLGKPSYHYILKLIKKGVLKARNKGTGKVPHFMVLGSEIKKYKKEVEGIEI